MNAKYQLEVIHEGACALRLRRTKLSLKLKESGRVLATARILGPLFRRFHKRLDRVLYAMELKADDILSAEERHNGA